MRLEWSAVVYICLSDDQFLQTFVSFSLATFGLIVA